MLPDPFRSMTLSKLLSDASKSELKRLDNVLEEARRLEVLDLLDLDGSDPRLMLPVSVPLLIVVSDALDRIAKLIDES